jgi:hypothetical protein
MSVIPWGVVWAALIVALVIVLGVCAVRLVRTFIRLMVASSEFLEKSAILDGVEATRELDRPAVAVLDNIDAIRAHYGLKMTRRANKKRSRAEARLARAKMITSLDPMQRM